MGMNNYAGTFPMASFNMKTCVITEKNCGVKVFRNTQLFLHFASTQLRTTRLLKYPIDPKAYLGSCVGHDLGPNCLQRLSADDTSRQRVKT